MNKPDLKPCPFCGSMAYTIAADNQNYGVLCHNCECVLGCKIEEDEYTCGAFDTEQEAITAWNTRKE